MTMAGSVLIAALALVVDFILGFVAKKDAKAQRQGKEDQPDLRGGRGSDLCLSADHFFAWQADRGYDPHCHKAHDGAVCAGRNAEDPDRKKDTDLHVELTQGVGGGTSNIQPAMESGEFDLYPEYTGTAWNMVMKEEGLYTEELFDDLQAFYNDELSMEWTGMYGFNNTYGLVVRREIAEQYDLKTYSDLARVSEQLVFGAEYDFFEREDGYDALCDTYGFHFKETMDLDIGLKYQAIDQGQIDVMVIFTTDGQLSASDVTVLEDDKQFYPSYLCGNVVRSEVMQEHPELEQIFEQVTGIISDGDMASMNYQVETEGREPEDVAEEFLESRGLL